MGDKHPNESNGFKKSSDVKPFEASVVEVEKPIEKPAEKLSAFQASSGLQARADELEACLWQAKFYLRKDQVNADAWARICKALGTEP